MLFNSYIFIFTFLPTVVLLSYLFAKKTQPRVILVLLVTASMVFYGWWNPSYIVLLIVSVSINYCFGIYLKKYPAVKLLSLGIIFNLVLLGYFKYAQFFIENLNALLGANIHIAKIVLPLAISFYTFQQIIYLVDCFRGATEECSFLEYYLFVTFFPQLIAGPIVHHRMMIPQFRENVLHRIKAENISVGLTIFIIGLFKKVVIADGVAKYSSPVFDAAMDGSKIGFFDAWGGAFAYTFQLYFDFSGYSDMAIGIARLWGIMLPVNFYSPYKASNINDFWRRWHITLSNFLRDYIYIPLGGNRYGKIRLTVNVLLTMFIAGLWHGAGWTFVMWGILHGCYLVMHHIWKTAYRAVHIPIVKIIRPLTNVLSRLTTFIVIVIAWVLFRSETIDCAKRIYSGMFGLNGVSIPVFLSRPDIVPVGGVTAPTPSPTLIGVFGSPWGYLYLLFLFIIVWILPNTSQWMGKYNSALGLNKFESEQSTCRLMRWRPNLIISLYVTILFLISLCFLNDASEFLYFQF